ncbi:BrxE family protein [Desulfobulbus alkaliphilus]|uniref:BrxE family protein n=1 Tax=Desulfobulbus alkaliphilus TaxID=869814 RepID=UPI001962DFE1|nr:BrxE family protein [Desulfobulbus alkaliphilus]MBM9538588.1 BrxE family protein [Desulfobulbus alkaliphilus]
MTSTSNIPEQFARMRLIVAYLGQANQAGWWDCNFLDTTGLRFLGTTFPRTARLAGLRSSTEAACSVHDKVMGRVGTYHLFRLPPAMEDHLEHVCEQMDWDEAITLINSPEWAMEKLKTIADCFVKAPEGPVQVGIARKIFTPTSAKEIASHYVSAFEDGIRCYPYFVAE